MQVETERFVMKRSLHVGPLRRRLSIGDVLAWTPKAKRLTINGEPVKDGAPPCDAAEAVRQLVALSEVEPNGTVMEELPEVTEENRPKTQTLTMLPVLGCLQAADEFLGTLTPQAMTDIQKQFLSLYWDKLAETKQLPELEWMADTAVQTINRWLKAHGFSIQLDDTGPGSIAVASILDVLEEWEKKGTETVLRTDRGEFPAVILKKGVRVFHDSSLHPYPVVRVSTKSRDQVCMTVVDSVKDGVFGLAQEVKEKQAVNGVEALSGQWSGVKFPMIDYDREEDIRWIIGMVVRRDWFIEQAIQQTKFRMDEEGAHVKSAAAMTLRKCSVPGPGPVVINKPFLLWIERQGIEQPLFAGVFGGDVWKKPPKRD